MTKPIIGITMDNDYIERNDKYMGLEIYYSQRVFADAVFAAGGIPMMLAQSSGDFAEEVIESIDGLIIIGGHDVTPLYYQEEPREKLGKVKPYRDQSDLALFKQALSHKIPVLGVCRGLQLINVALGGTLHQDLSESADIYIQHDQKAAPNQVVHSIKVEADSYLAKLIKDQSLVNSVHHQIVKHLSAELIATAWSNDGAIEAFESKEDIPLIIGVQWHPEVLYQDNQDQLAIFEDLVERARTYKTQ